MPPRVPSRPRGAAVQSLRFPPRKTAPGRIVRTVFGSGRAWKNSPEGRRTLESVDIAEAIRLKGGEKPQRPQRDAESLLLFELVDHSLDSIL